MLMFSKVSVKSFVYDLIDVFMFLIQDVQKIYQKYKISKCYLYQNLTDTYSTLKNPKKFYKKGSQIIHESMQMKSVKCSLDN